MRKRSFSERIDEEEYMVSMRAHTLTHNCTQFCSNYRRYNSNSMEQSLLAHRTIEWEFIQLIVNVTLNYYYIPARKRTREKQTSHIVNVNIQIVP